MIFKKKIDIGKGKELLSRYRISDVHTHILPGIDDGSKDTEESVRLLTALSEQGIDTVVATPHYYPTEKSPDSFLTLRDNAWELLSEKLTESLPRVKLGAEVLYFRGISRMESLERLCVQGTKTLLLEMPSDLWSEYILREIFDIQRSRGIDVVMAHIERYMQKQPSSLFNQLLTGGVKMQINASSLTGKQGKKLAKMLSDGMIHFIGSDCHNMTTRAPDMASAAATVAAYAGEEVFAMLSKSCGVYFG
ncbi:MAG: histidinol-phosphatase [Clostridia bacterium]|nr:histidinol-phosphatase [Clostridia bacterium]